MSAAGKIQARRNRTAAQSWSRCDRHALYEVATQRPEIMIGFLEGLLPRALRRGAAVLREDFCGSAHLAGTWVASGQGRRAVAIDIDPRVLRVAERRARRPLGAAGERLELIQGDVRACRRMADLIAALNFSWCVFHRRDELLGYFRHLRRCLNPGGCAVLDLYGGPAALGPGIEKRRFGDFTYVWEQASCDPVTGRVVNHIHFEFPGGRRMRRAFTYDWRLWTIPEVADLCDEAGLKLRDLYFEGDAGRIGREDPAEAEAWVAYLVLGRDAEKERTRRRGEGRR